MSPRGFSSLLAIPPALRSVLLKALVLTAAATPSLALVSPSFCAPAQCRWKHTTSRAPMKKKSSSSGVSKKARPAAASSRKTPTPSRGPPKGKNPNGYPSGPKRPSRAAPSSKARDRDRDSCTLRAASSRASPSAIPQASNLTDSYPPRPSLWSSWDDPPPVLKEKQTRFPPKAKPLSVAVSPGLSTTTDPPSARQATPPKPAEQRAPTPQLDNERDSREPKQPPDVLSFVPPPPTLPITATPAPPLTKLDLTRTASLFRNPKFLYTAPRFFTLPINTRMPEICLLGRSNVGKSTLINAIGGHGGKKAGSLRVTSQAKLAITSATAGCTKTMNAYGFGPPLSVKPLSQKQQRARTAAGRSRGAQRAGKAKIPPEALPKHSLVLMDMPGYGLNSRADWGAEIMKYLHRREILAGAVLLIDAVAGVKDGDRGVLAILRDAGLPTSIVLTKADKLVRSSADPAAWRASARLREACAHVWAEVRRVEGAADGPAAWWEGDGWTPEIFVTGAGDPRTGGMGVAGARVAIARLAGLLAAPPAAAPQPAVVPYDQLVFALPSAAAPRFEVPQAHEQEVVTRARRPVVGRGRTRLRTVGAGKPPADPLQAMEAAMHRPQTRGPMGKASF